MTSNSPQIQDIADRHGFSRGAVIEAIDALRRGGGSMAQFRHPEFGGSGQWIPGMTMIGDMFNSSLKARVENLFSDLIAHPPSPSPASSDSAGSRAQPEEGGVSLRYGSPAGMQGEWYPPGLGHPATAGAQNHLRYAYFPDSRRLAIQLSGKTTLYDTGPHHISGVSQSQSNDAGDISFTSQFGVIPLSSLRVVET